MSGLNFGSFGPLSLDLTGVLHPKVDSDEHDEYLEDTFSLLFNHGDGFAGHDAIGEKISDIIRDQHLELRLNETG